MGAHEMSVLKKYGVSQLSTVPSVYGNSNLSLDSGGEGLYIENTEADFYVRIVQEVSAMVKASRAVIAFFEDSDKLKCFVQSANYTTLPFRKTLLTEDLSKEDKNFAIKKAPM